MAANDKPPGVPLVTQQKIMEVILQPISRFSTSVLGLLPNKPPIYWGSGTLVRVGYWRCVLTAAHVWTNVRDYWKVALSAGDGKPAISSQVDHFRVLYLTDPLEPPDWGPDLALVEILPIYADSLEDGGRSAFYNLVLRRHHPLLNEPVAVNEPRALFGAPGEFTKTGSKMHGSDRLATAAVGTMMIGSRVLAPHRRDAHDFVDLSLDKKLDDGFPKDYGGMSGSGLWWFGREEGGLIACTPQDLFLDGVAYLWDEGKTPADEMIRCHGRVSIYRTMLDAVLPEL